MSNHVFAAWYVNIVLELSVQMKHNSFLTMPLWRNAGRVLTSFPIKVAIDHPSVSPCNMKNSFLAVYAVMLKAFLLPLCSRTTWHPFKGFRLS